MMEGQEFLTGRQTDRVTARQSNIELLRIIAMFMIVMNHFSVHGGFQFPIEYLSINKLWTQFTVLGNIGVDIFVLISGYFLVEAREHKTSKVIRIWLQMVTYSVLIYCFFVVFGIESFSIKTLVKCIIPVSQSKWWFASTYFVMYLLSPYINQLLNALNKGLYQRMLVSLTIYWCLIPMFLLSGFEGNNLLWFIYLYSVAGYVRLHVRRTHASSKKYLLCSIVAYVLFCIAVAVQDILVTRSKYFGYISLNTRQSAPVLLISVLLFLTFLKMDIPYCKLINSMIRASKAPFPKIEVWKI